MRIIVKNFINLLRKLREQKYQNYFNFDKPSDELIADTISFLNYEFGMINDYHAQIGNINETNNVVLCDHITPVKNGVVIEFNMIESTYGLNIKMTLKSNGIIEIISLEGYKFVYSNNGNELRKIRIFTDTEMSALRLASVENTDDIVLNSLYL